MFLFFSLLKTSKFIGLSLEPCRCHRAGNSNPFISFHFVSFLISFLVSILSPEHGVVWVDVLAVHLDVKWLLQGLSLGC